MRQRKRQLRQRKNSEIFQCPKKLKKIKSQKTLHTSYLRHLECFIFEIMGPRNWNFVGDLRTRNMRQSSRVPHCLAPLASQCSHLRERQRQRHHGCYTFGCSILCSIPRLTLVRSHDSSLCSFHKRRIQRRCTTQAVRIIRITRANM